MEVWWPPIKVYFTPFITMTIRVFEAFSGVGSQRMALRNLGIDHEVVAIAEIDKFAIKSYEAIHGETNNLGDISQLGTDDIPDHDLFTYSFPCQDISVAGKGLGLDEGSDTRSGLLWECQKVIAGKKPKYLLLENVKNLVGKKHKHNFDRWLYWLGEQGYTNYWQVLNAKNYGIPQNRERVFVVSILGGHTPYKFPEPIELELRLKDVLEEVVDEKFYLSEEKTQQLITTVPKNHCIITHNYIEQVKVRKHEVDINRLRDLLRSHKQSSGKTNKEISEFLDEPITLVEHWFRNDKSFAIPKEDKWLQLKEILSISTDSFDEQIMEFETRDGVFDQANRAYDSDGISPTLTATDGDKKILIKNATKKGYIEAHDGDGVDLAYPTSKTRRGRVQKGLSQTLDTSDSKGVVIAASRGRNPKNPSDRTIGSPTEQRLEINKQGTSNTITTVQKDNYVVYDNYRIRKLTPKECWRLMGFSDDDFHKAESVNSNSQLYKQAGNSIVVDVLEGIFKQLLEEQEWNN